MSVHRHFILTTSLQIPQIYRNNVRSKPVSIAAATRNIVLITRQKLKVTELKELLSKHDLPQTGKKDDLVKRLLEANVAAPGEGEEELVSDPDRHTSKLIPDRPGRRTTSYRECTCKLDPSRDGHELIVDYLRSSTTRIYHRTNINASSTSYEISSRTIRNCIQPKPNTYRVQTKTISPRRRFDSRS